MYSLLPSPPLSSPPTHSKVEEAKITEKEINEAREIYRPAAARASLLYFILNDLNKINPLYQFSLKVSFYKSRNLLVSKSVGYF